MVEIGDNSCTQELLKQVIERVEKLVEERKGINDHIKSILDQAEMEGLDKKTIREMVKLRAIDTAEREEREALRALYMSSIGLA